MVAIHANFDTITRGLVQRIEIYARQTARDIDAVMAQQSGEFHDDLYRGSPVDKDVFRTAWQAERVGPAHYRHSNHTPHAAIINFGGYPGVGPKTQAEGGQTFPGGIVVGGGIFPTQRPSHVVERALSKRIVALNDAISKVMKR